MKRFQSGRFWGAMEDAANDVNIMILDACRNNPFSRRWQRSTQSQGLAPVQAVRGSYIAYATAPGDVALDGEGRNGTFTEQLLKHIGTPNLTVEEMFKRVRQDVLQATDNEQMPWDSSSLVGEFSFNPLSTPVATSNPEPESTPPASTSSPEPESTPPATTPQQDSAENFLQQGRERFARKDYQGAIDSFTQAIALNPNNAKVYYNRGNAYGNLQQYQQALADFNKAIELDPNLAIAYSSRGATYIGLQQYQQALVEFNKAIELDPNLAGAYSSRGSVYSELKDYQQALADYNKAIELDPNLAGAYIGRGFTYSQLDEIEKAIIDAEKATQLFCQQGSPLCQQAQELLKTLRQLQTLGN